MFQKTTRMLPISKVKLLCHSELTQLLLWRS